MAVIYPKRSYAAPLDATSLDWQRAAVIVFHDQPGSLPAGLPRPARAAQAGAKRVQGFGAVFAIVLLAVLAWAIQHRQSEQAADAAVSWGSQSADGPGAALAAAMLNMSEADASLLRSLPRRLGPADASPFALALGPEKGRVPLLAGARQEHADEVREMFELARHLPPLRACGCAS